MAPHTLEKQLEQVAQGRKNIADVQTDQGKVIVLSGQLGDRFRKILEYMARQFSETPNAATVNHSWTDGKNARRAALIDKKYDDSLTAAEKKELRSLERELEQHASLVAPMRNEMLELILIGLEHRAAQGKKSRRKAV